jgi:hypothetical protein
VMSYTSILVIEFLLISYDAAHAGGCVVDFGGFEYHTCQNKWKRIENGLLETGNGLVIYICHLLYMKILQDCLSK